MNTQHIIFFILEGCILLSITVGTGMYYRRVIRSKHRTMYRLIKECDLWKNKWHSLMRTNMQSKQSDPQCRDFARNVSKEQEETIFFKQTKYYYHGKFNEHNEQSNAKWRFLLPQGTQRFFAKHAIC